MAKYAFSAQQRWAVFSVHGDRCYLCGAPLDLKTMQVDHVIPESLLNEPEELDKLLAEYNLPKGFNLNSYENWRPSCSPCNNRKRTRTFKPSLRLSIELDIGIERADRCRELESQQLSSSKVASALSYLERASEMGLLDFNKLTPLVIAYAKTDKKAWRALHREIDEEKTLSDDLLGMVIEAPENRVFRISPRYSVLYSSDEIQIVDSQHGPGYVPTNENLHSSFYCGHCGSKGPWNGARCLTCGYLDDGD